MNKIFELIFGLLLSILMLVVFNFSTCAQSSPTIIPSSFESYDLFEFSLSDQFYYLPSSEALTAVEIYDKRDSFLHTRYPNSSWRLLRLVNDSDVEHFSIRFMSQHDHIKVYRDGIGNPKVEEDSLGIQVLNSEAEVMPRLMSYDFMLPQGDSINIFFNGSFSNDNIPELTLNSYDQIKKYSDHYARISYVFSAIFLMMLLYNLSILLIVKDRSYIYYSVMAAGYLLHAFNYQLEYWFTALTASHITVISATVISVGGMGFWGTFLVIKNGVWTWLWKFIELVGAALIITVIVILALDYSSLSTFKITSLVAAFLAFVSIAIWTISSVIFSLRGVKKARLFVIANLPLVAGALLFLTIWTMTRFTEIQFGSKMIILTNYIFFGSLALQMLLFSITIGYAIKKASVLQLASERNQRQLLENMVNERTRELQRINKELSGKNKELEQTNGTKNRLLTILSHDLRTPINNVASLISLLKEHQFSQEDFTSLIPELEKSIADTTSFMALLISWTQSQSDGLTPNKVLLDIQSIIQQNIEFHNEAIEAKQLEVLVDAAEVEVFADLNMIDLVIRNLISNAVKFSNSGGIVQVVVSMEDNHSITIKIVDNGVGIDSTRHDLFFDVSKRNTTIGTAGEKGFGMGLILCKDFVELNGGILTFSSEKGKGSTFIVTIPS